MIYANKEEKEYKYRGFAMELHLCFLRPSQVLHETEKYRIIRDTRLYLLLKPRCNVFFVFWRTCWKPDTVLVPKSNFMNDSHWRNQPLAETLETHETEQKYVGSLHWDLFEGESFPFPSEFGWVCVDPVALPFGISLSFNHQAFPSLKQPKQS